MKKILEFCDLKSKVYTIIVSENNKENNKKDNKKISKAKGVNKKLRHKEFVDVLFNKRVIRHNMKRIQSKLHELGTYDVFKISLSCFDDKQYVLNDGVNNLTYFHKNIRNIDEDDKANKNL